MSARKSNDITTIFSYRITEADKKIIAEEHKSLTEFFNKVVKKELKRLEKIKGVKQKTA